MKFKKYTGITWSDVELAGLIEDEDSYVSLDRCKKHFALHPSQLTNIKHALNEILCSMLNLYDRDLKGFPIAYKNPKLLSSLGEIIHDSCFIHIDIEVNFYIFRPKMEISLKGVVSKIAPSYVGLVVHKAFTVIVLKPTGDKNWVGNHVQMWQQVRVTLTDLHLESDVLPYIGGIFKPDDYLRGCRLLETCVNTNCILFNDNLEGDTDKTTRKYYKPLKHKFFENNSKTFSAENVSSTKKKKNKHKHLNKSLEQEVVTYSEKEKKDKRCKTVKEVVQLESPKYTSNICTNNKFTKNEELVKCIHPKSKFKRKSKRHSSESSINEDIKKICEKYRSKKKFKRLSATVKVDKLNKIKNMEETMLENKVKLKKNSRKRKRVDNSGHSSEEFSSYNYISPTVKKNSKSSNDSKEICVDIKMEKSDDTYKKNKIKKSSKKEWKMDLETSESDTNGNSKTASLKGKSRNYKIQNTKIKTERLTISSENMQDEDCKKSSTIYCDLDENVENDMRKKQTKHSENKIKTEPKFEETVTKIERPGNEDRDTYWENVQNSLKIVLPLKKRKVTFI
nr:PREDICTED: DNA-directed RNA polymerase I subunit RPA43-like [Megachile rotundata]